MTSSNDARWETRCRILLILISCGIISVWMGWTLCLLCQWMFQEPIKSSTLICLVVWLNTHTIFTKHVTFIDENIYHGTPLLPAYSTWHLHTLALFTFARLGPHRPSGDIILSKVIQLTISSLIYLSHLHWALTHLMSRLQKDVNKATSSDEPLRPSDAVTAGMGVQLLFQKENVVNRTGESSGVTSSCFMKVKNCPFSSLHWLNTTSFLCRVLTNIKLFLSIKSESQNPIDWHWLNSCGWVRYWKSTCWDLKVRACFGNEAGQQH